MCLHSSHKLGWESSLFPATDESQVSNKLWGIQKLSWPSLQVKDLSKAISGNLFFLPELIDVLALDGHVMQKVIWAGMRLLFDLVVNWHGHLKRF